MKKIRNGGTLNIFDVDQTLFNNTAKTKVIRDGKLIARLNTHGLENFVFQDNDVLDYSEYECGKFFKSDATPIKPMIRRAQLVHRFQGNQSKSIIITGRCDLKHKEYFLEKFRDHGFPIDDIYIERAGNLVRDGKFNRGDIAGAKSYIINNYLEKGHFDTVRMWDDSEENLKSFFQLRFLYPEKNFLAFKVNPKTGSVRKMFTK